MTIVKYLKLPFLFDVERFQSDVRALQETAWQLHYQKLHYQGNWTALPLRSQGGDARNIIVSPDSTRPYHDTVFLSATPYFREVLSHFQCPQRAVRLMKLASGAIIKQHTDADLHFEQGEARLHIPIATHPGVEFWVDRERLPLAEGECWYINFNLPHSVRNNSPVDRIHLVVDVTVNDWIREVFRSPAIEVRKEIPQPLVTYDERTKREMILRFRAMNTPTANGMADEFEAQLAGGSGNAV